ncbi:PTS sugar transporter subunit IIA [Cryobacterium sp.]|jgi:PTS system fructose-specific IIC component|uniref:PTS sugar transporter subunit IIA n=1 Tax=Cryobacterium sp. TaxID=1926290 RepID=UPI002626A291|nr:fructose PTS transporter subunit IIA [Cryobacterium sp.]MCU1444444.1 fructose transporter subunit [Cryobacterium sp.]
MPDPSTVVILVSILVAVLVLAPVIVISVRRLRGTKATIVASTASPAAGAQAAVVPGAVAPAAIVTGPATPTAKTVLDYIDERTIALEVEDTDRDAVIRRLAALMSTTGRVLDEDAVVRAALDRELMSTTGIGEGIAIPHAESDGAIEPVLAFARSKAGVDWNSLDEAPAHLIFLIAVPKSAAGTEHLKVLAQLSRSLMKPSFRAAIEMAATPADVLAALASTVRPAAAPR